MTAPAPPAPAKRRRERRQPRSRAEVLAAIAALVAAGALAGTAIAAYQAGKRTASGIAAVLALLAELGIPRQSGRLAVRVATSVPMPITRPDGPVSERVFRSEPARRAAYLVNAAERINQALDQARSQPAPPGVTEAEQQQQAVREALEAERRYAEQHAEAQRARREAAVQIDTAAAKYGPLLGWYARINSPTVTRECAQAHAANFRPADPPRIGLPGIGPHAGCRCVAGPPFATRRMVNEAVTTPAAA